MCVWGGAPGILSLHETLRFREVEHFVPSHPVGNPEPWYSVWCRFHCTLLLLSLNSCPLFSFTSKELQTGQATGNVLTRFLLEDTGAMFGPCNSHDFVLASGIWVMWHSGMRGDLSRLPEADNYPSQPLTGGFLTQKVQSTSNCI